MENLYDTYEWRIYYEELSECLGGLNYNLDDQVIEIALDKNFSTKSITNFDIGILPLAVYRNGKFVTAAPNDISGKNEMMYIEMITTYIGITEETLKEAAEIRAKAIAYCE